MPSWRGKWPTPQMSIDGAAPTEERYRPRMLESPWHPGWIAVTILGFIIWWPIGLALLFFTLGSRKMGCWSHQDRWQNKMERMQYKMDRMRDRMERRGFAASASVRPRAATAPSTNTARKPCGVSRKSRPSSRDFLDRLRHAKDKEEFDQFMAQHKQRPTPPNDQPQQLSARVSKFSLRRDAPMMPDGGYSRPSAKAGGRFVFADVPHGWRRSATGLYLRTR